MTTARVSEGSVSAQALHDEPTLTKSTPRESSASTDVVW